MGAFRDVTRFLTSASAYPGQLDGTTGWNPIDAGMAAVRDRNVARARVIPVREAVRIIALNNLKPACGVWHFSWDIERFCETMMLQTIDGALHICAPRPLNEWAPVAHFTDSPDPVPLRTGKREALPYWFLRITAFEDFLDRCSAANSRPGDHFPSRATYPRAATRLGCHLEHMKLHGNEERFARWYDALKDARYKHTGDECWRSAIASNPGVPQGWFTVSALTETDTGACKAVQLAVSDHLSHSGISIAAARRSRFGYGVMLAVEEIKRLCAAGATSFDYGVSGNYGGYKKQIFLDAVPTVVAR